ncbi:MAG: hypothetical protein IKZ72_04110 [Bacteroidales bacterium]|nr:hypothetical protein [Bacteroidales bacterium]
MTSIILSTVCALALNAAALPASTDTTDIYLIDYARVENFDGSQLAGKRVISYKITREDLAGVPARVHLITTDANKDGTNPVVIMGSPDLSNVTVVSIDQAEQRPSITIRPTDPSMSVDDILFFIDGKQIASDEFKKLDPKNIASMEVMKDASAEAYLQGLKDQGLVPKDINPKGGVVLVKTKKGAK